MHTNLKALLFTGLGFLLGFLIHQPQDPDLPPEFSRKRPTSQPQVTHLNLDPDASCEDLRRQVQEMTSQLAIQEAITESMGEELYGVPQPFPEDLPDIYQEDFPDQVREAIEQCNPPVDLIEVDCSEYPCLAVLRVKSGSWWMELVNNCPAWRDTYGTISTSASSQGICKDGSIEKIALIGPTAPHELNFNWDNPSPEEEAASRNVMRRLSSRREDITANWRCAGED